ncbi:hypothetical protein GCM10020000_43890 [Streptomyces olivoverticillatus]
MAVAGGADGKPHTFDVDVSGVRYWAAGDLAAGPSSGSYPAKGMLIVPASTACVAGVALGLSKDLLQRVASVTLKERRPLIVAVRETPLSGQTLKQLVALDEAGAVVLPASPAFYAGGRRTSRIWWTSSPGGCWMRQGCRTRCTAGGRESSVVRWALVTGAVSAVRVSASCGRSARAWARRRARRRGGLVGTRAVGQVLQLTHAGVGHLDRVHENVTPEGSSLSR